MAAAVALEPNNLTYLREHEAVKAALLKETLAAAAQARAGGRQESAVKALSSARRLDPDNSLVNEEASAEALQFTPPAVVRDGSRMQIDSGVIVLAAKPEKQEIHFRGSERELLRQTFEKFGITPTMDESVPTQTTKADTEPLDFADASRIVLMMTNCFYVPLDPHRVLIAKDTRQNREKFEREFYETVYLPGLTQTEMQDATNILKQTLEIRQVATDTSGQKIAIRAPEALLKVANETLQGLYSGHAQVLLSMSVYQLTRTRENDIGIELPSNFALYNIPSEEAAIFSQYSTEIEQLIASGAVSANNPLEILAALVAAGVLNSAPFNEGFFVFGGGLTATALTAGNTSANFLLNSVDVRQLDRIQLRVGNGEQATFRDGSRYPIVTASYSSAFNASALAGANIPGLSALVAGAGALAAAATPNIQYTDLGLTLKAKPQVQKDRSMSLQLELTIASLAGTTLNNNPILNNRELKTTIGVKEGEASVIAGIVSRQEVKSLVGIPFLNDIPGFPATNSDRQVNRSELVIILTPHIVRLDHTEAAGPLINIPLH